jgi:hypothetical protein
MRGWSRTERAGRNTLSVLPAHAGMVPVVLVLGERAYSAPRACGDGQFRMRPERRFYLCSPRMRGWSRPAPYSTVTLHWPQHHLLAQALHPEPVVAMAYSPALVPRQACKKVELPGNSGVQPGFGLEQDRPFPTLIGEPGAVRVDDDLTLVPCWLAELFPCAVGGFYLIP